MKLFVLGVNHETAPVDIREKVSFCPEQVKSALQDLRHKSLVKEAIIVSTCNRTELYVTLIAPQDTEATARQQALIHWLHQRFELPDQTLNPFLYQYQDLAAIQHMMRVACGLNSLVLGEPQILGQMKEAYHLAQKADSANQVLNALLQHIFKTAKQVRTDTAIGSSPVSVAFSAVALSKQFFGELSKQTALLIGAGETSELVARHLHESGIGHLVIANRTLDKAHQLATQLGGYAINLAEIDDHLHEADMIIASTGAPNVLLHQSQVAQALKKRRNKPMFMVDIAVPRDIDASIGAFHDTYLYTVDDLQAIIAENKRSRQDAALAAEEIIDVQAQAFLNQYQATQQVSPIIQSFRTQANELKQHTLAQAMAALEKGDDPTQVVTKLANQLTNKLLHTPTKQLHQAGMTGEQSLIDAAQQLLLDADNETTPPSEPGAKADPKTDAKAATNSDTDKHKVSPSSQAQWAQQPTSSHTSSHTSSPSSSPTTTPHRPKLATSQPRPGFFQAKPSDAL